METNDYIYSLIENEFNDELIIIKPRLCKDVIKDVTNNGLKYNITSRKHILNEFDTDSIVNIISLTVNIVVMAIELYKIHKEKDVEKVNEIIKKEISEIFIENNVTISSSLNESIDKICYYVANNPPA